MLAGRGDYRDGGRPRPHPLRVRDWSTAADWLALQWSNIDLPDRSFTVTRTVQNGVIVEASGKTRDSLRTILLNDLAHKALASLPTPLHGNLLVFPGKRSGGIIDHGKWRRGPWTNALAAAGVAYRASPDRTQTDSAATELQ
jgi:integrase